MPVKYGIWHVAQLPAQAASALGAYPPLTAMVLAARGIDTPQQAQAYLAVDCPLPDPFLLTDMVPAVERIRLALNNGEKIVVFGDYDVDGVTATCLLTDFLRKQGGDCRYYIPSRLEEGYGLNPGAIRQLAGQGVSLMITVDCGITAEAEAKLCRELGMDLVITDHHACKASLPDAVAVVDPHRPGDKYPHRNLSGVGVAFKLAAALAGDQQAVLNSYADLVCLGTVADVMPLLGENRTIVARGLAAMRESPRPGLRCLMHEAGCDPATLTAITVGFVLAPRINAAGRMGRIDLAVELLLDVSLAPQAAKQLCQLNRQRQAVESEIYHQALAMLPQGKTPEAIVLASPDWHQGVVGIVASKMAEEFCCPTFLICLDGDKGKASSRSYGGFNLFQSLTELSGLLDTYGGHELAAGFTIDRQHIGQFRQAVCRQAAEYFRDGLPSATLEVDCAIPPELLTIANVQALDALEPCGSGCPRPVFLLEAMTIDRIIPIGGGRHLRLRLHQGQHPVNAICFSATAQSLSIAPGDVVDLACTLQINDYRGQRSVQVTVLDLRPSCPCPCDADLAGYRSLRSGSLSREQAAGLLPTRQVLADIWRYLAAYPGQAQVDPVCLCRKIVRATGRPLGLSQLLACLDIFREAGLMEVVRQQKYLTITLTASGGKADLTQCVTMRLLQQLKEG